jgi:asparagine synthase (glutamine-hydrolysing)
MSGIAGIYYFDAAPAESTSVEKMTAAMATRGPDGIHHWVAGPVALGHCMLRTTPESQTEAQPLTNEDASVVLVLDGRVDNREALRRELRGHGTVLRTQTDAELVLRAYEVWDRDCVHHLDGDYAFVIWDARRRVVFCCVDPMGARSLYYTVHSTERFFAFASDEEALLTLTGISRQPNAEQIASLFVPAFQDLDNPRSWLRDIRGLMPAETLTVQADGTFRVASYWRLDPGDERPFASDQECEAAFLEVFGDAVRRRLHGSEPIAAMMSGGLDSAGIAAMVNRLRSEGPGRAFHTYSVISDQPASCVESQCVQNLTQGRDITSHVLSVPSFQGPVSLPDALEAIWSRAHPIDNSISIPMMMCMAARAHDHRVLMTGVSGDLAMYVPYRYVAYLLRAGQWRQAWRECRGASQNHFFLRGRSPLALLLLNGWTAFMPGRVKALANRMRHPNLEVLNPDFARDLRITARLHEQYARDVRHWGRSVARDHAEVVASPFGIVLGLSGYDRVAGRYGVELRDPWADRRLVEFFLRLPLRYKVRDGRAKHLVRAAFRSDLADRVRLRVGKEHLGPIVTSRLMNESEQLISQVMAHHLKRIEGYVNVGRVRENYIKYRKYNELRSQQLIYEMVTLALWLERIETRL